MQCVFIQFEEANKQNFAHIITRFRLAVKDGSDCCYAIYEQSRGEHHVAYAPIDNYEIREKSHLKVVQQADFIFEHSNDESASYGNMEVQSVDDLFALRSH